MYENSINIMLIGMSFVFLFLIIIIFCINFVAKLIDIFEKLTKNEKDLQKIAIAITTANRLRNKTE